MIDLPVNADTAENARRQAVSLLRSMGYRTVSNIRILAQDPPDVADAFAMSHNLRRFTVQAQVVR